MLYDLTDFNNRGVGESELAEKVSKRVKKEPGEAGDTANAAALSVKVLSDKQAVGIALASLFICQTPATNTLGIPESGMLRTTFRYSRNMPSIAEGASGDADGNPCQFLTDSFIKDNGAARPVAHRLLWEKLLVSGLLPVRSRRFKEGGLRTVHTQALAFFALDAVCEWQI